MMTARRFSAAAVLCAGALSVSGCAQLGSQIDSLKQVSGVPVNTLQIATDTVLTSQQVPILVAPTCVQDKDNADNLTCKGKTTANEEILVTATNGPAVTATFTPGGTPTALPAGTLDLNMKLTVGGKVLYEGSAQSVIDKSQGGAK
jgi:hypothetical protein